MTGTEKQIEWANRIKPELLSKASTYVHQDKLKGHPFQPLYLDIYAVLESNESASFWIDNRNAEGGGYLIQLALKASPELMARYAAIKTTL